LAADGFEVDRASDRLLVALGDGEPRGTAGRVNRLAHEHGIVLAELAPRRHNLEDRYLTLIQGGTR
jgi:hypothetical protein